jgi:hypothetical protein
MPVTGCGGLYLVYKTGTRKAMSTVLNVAYFIPAWGLILVFVTVVSRSALVPTKPPNGAYDCSIEVKAAESKLSSHIHLASRL